MVTFGSVKSRRVAIITGASSGLGKEFAKIFAADGVDVVLVARRTSLLKKIAAELRKEYSVNVYVYTLDLSNGDSPKKLFSFVKKNNLKVYYLINNAGFGEYGLFDSILDKKVSDMIMVNMYVLTKLCHVFLPQMRKRKCGYILNVASTAAFIPGPFMAEYFATKAYVLSLSEALSKEYEPYNVYVTALCPGPTQTDFIKSNNLQNINIFKSDMPSAYDVAIFGYNAMLKSKSVVVYGNKNRTLALITRFLPRSFVANKAYKIMLNSNTKN